MIDHQPIFTDFTDGFGELLEIERFDDVTVGTHLLGAHDIALLGG
jgi:hypothetical protein